jgi:thioredoxin reductase
MARTDAPHIAILGAGPIGLEAALYARRLDLPVTVYERGQPGQHLRHWGHVRLFSPFGSNCTPLGRAAILAENPRHAFPAEGDNVTGKEHLAVYLEPLARHALVKECLRTGVEVLHVGRRGYLKDDPADARRGQQAFLLQVREGKKGDRVEEADVVLDCTGTYGRHRWLGQGGIPALGEAAAEAQIAYGLDDVLGERRSHYAGKNILVVGAGYSAATTVCNLAALAEQHPDTWVVWVARGSSSQPIRRIAGDPLKERDRLAVRANTLATRAEGNVEFHPQTVIEAVEALEKDRGFRVRARGGGGRERTWEVDRIVANVGYTPDTALYRELQVHESYLTPMALASALLKQAGDGPPGSGLGPALLRNPEPNFYLLGAKSYGRNGTFLLRAGFEQVRDVFTLIAGQAGLDLYKKPRW